MPLALLDRRPDLVAARERLVAAFFGAEEAKAARLPTIAIFAGAGRFTKDYSGLATSMQSWVFPVGASLAWPLFDAGRRQITLELRTEQQREALALYARAILGAMAEVENGLTGEQQLAMREQSLQRQYSESRRALALAQVQRQIGQFDDFDVLQRKRDAARAKRPDARARRKAGAAREPASGAGRTLRVGCADDPRDASVNAKQPRRRSGRVARYGCGCEPAPNRSACRGPPTPGHSQSAQPPHAKYSAPD